MQAEQVEAAKEHVVVRQKVFAILRAVAVKAGFISMNMARQRSSASGVMRRGRRLSGREQIWMTWSYALRMRRRLTTSRTLAGVMRDMSVTRCECSSHMMRCMSSSGTTYDSLPWICFRHSSKCEMRLYENVVIS